MFMQMTFSKSKYPHNNGSGKENVGGDCFCRSRTRGIIMLNKNMLNMYWTNAHWFPDGVYIWGRGNEEKGGR